MRIDTFQIYVNFVEGGTFGKGFFLYQSRQSKMIYLFIYVLWSYISILVLQFSFYLAVSLFCCDLLFIVRSRWSLKLHPWIFFSLTLMVLQSTSVTWRQIFQLCWVFHSNIRQVHKYSCSSQPIHESFLLWSSRGLIPIYWPADQIAARMELHH